MVASPSMARALAASGTACLAVASAIGFASACGGSITAATSPHHASAHVGRDDGGRVLGAAGDAGDPLPSLASLASLAPSLAPGLRESDRVEVAGEVDLVHELPKLERDTCVRVTFAATAPVTATLVDGAGNVLARTTTPGTTGSLGERGPACARPRASPLLVKLHAETPGSVRARLVAWASP